MPFDQTRAGVSRWKMREWAPEGYRPVESALFQTKKPKPGRAPFVPDVYTSGCRMTGFLRTDRTHTHVRCISDRDTHCPELEQNRRCIVGHTPKHRTTKRARHGRKDRALHRRVDRNRRTTYTARWNFTRDASASPGVFSKI